MPGTKAGEEDRKEQLLAAAHDVAVRHGLERLTVRRVAAAAGLSHGLVHFHFASKDRLLMALLDRLLERTSAFEVGPEISTLPSPLERLLALLRQEMRRLSNDRESLHLFFDFWLMGTRNPEVRREMRAELERYRDAFRPMVEEVLLSDPDRFEGVSAEGLSALVVAFIKGSAIQSVIHPGAVDVDQFTAAANALLTRLEGKGGPGTPMPTGASAPGVDGRSRRPVR